MKNCSHWSKNGLGVLEMVVGSGEQDNGPKIIENTVDCIQGGKPGTFAVQNPVLYTVGDNLSRI